MKKKIIPAILTASLVAMILSPAAVMAAQPSVGLGTTARFAILSGETITNTGTTTIGGTAGGDVGMHPGSDFTGQETIIMSGALHLADATANTAKIDLGTAYDDAAGRSNVTIIPSELGGTTLVAGTYASTDGTFNITGTLTLNAEGDPAAVFIFQTTKTLITASASSVNLISGAQTCNVFWKVGSSVTLGTNSTFVGHVFALTSISADTGAIIQGQLLARNGSVTLQGNTITNNICTVNGGKLPYTATSNYTSLLVGGLLIVMGIGSLFVKKHYEQK